MNEHVEYKAKEANKGTRFLWWCAGADPEILKYSSYSDHVKFAGIGGVVLATGILAAISMGFAIQIIFETPAATAIIGLLWGAIIFNLDRFIVTSTGKGDGTDSISGKELVNAAPRLVMAIILGLTISAPLEVYIFQPEINKQFYKMNEAEKMSEIKKIEKEYTTSPEFKAINDNIKKKEEEKAGFQKLYEEAMAGAKAENSTERGGCGPKCQEYKNMAAAEQAKIDRVQGEIDKLNVELEGYKKNKEDRIAKLSEVNEQSHGMLDRLRALHDVPDSGAAIWLIRLMFIFIEIAPVLLKLMLIKGPYDYMSENVNQILETKQGISVKIIVDEHDKTKKLKINHNPHRIIAIVEHQNLKEEENAKAAIDAYANKEKKDIEANPEDFMKS